MDLSDFMAWVLFPMVIPGHEDKHQTMRLSFTGKLGIKHGIFYKLRFGKIYGFFTRVENI
jgi:hypothetical protein